jgi:phosphoribosylanthranilate isomerase
MTWVKLCGMTRRPDVEAAVDAGADAVGFVTHPGSPRCVTPDAIAVLVDGIPLTAFLVTVDAEPGWLVDTAAGLGVGGVQPHGSMAAESAEAAVAAGLQVLFPVHPASPQAPVDPPAGAVPLLDNAAPGLHGGTGRSFDWSLTAGVSGPFVLAGGLHPGNVARAVEITGAWGVDVAGGVESSPGVKDHEMMRMFVDLAKGGAR